MLKRIFLFILLAFSLYSSYSQEAILDSFSSKFFPGIINIQMSPISFTYYITTEKGKPVLVAKVFNDRMEPFTSIKYPVTKTTVILGATFIDRGILFLTGDPAEKTRTLIALDNASKVIFENKEQNISSDLLNKDLPYYVFNVIPQGAVIVRPVSIKNGSFKVTRLNNEQQVSWDTVISSQKGNLSVVQVGLNMHQLTLLYKETNKDKSTYYATNLNIENGDPMHGSVLQDGGDHLFPLFFNNKDGQAFSGGFYYKDGKFDGGTGGIYGAMMGPDGTIMKKVKFSFNDYSKFLPQHLIDEINNGAKLTVVNLYISEPNSINLVCELFKRSGTSHETIIKTSDLMIIKTDEQDQIIALDLLPNISSHHFVIRNSPVPENDITAIEWASKNRLFHHRFMAGNGHENYLCYANIDSTIKLLAINVDSSKKGHPLKELAPSAGVDILKKTAKGNFLEIDNIATGTLGKWRFADMSKSTPEDIIRVYTILDSSRVTIKSLPHNFLRQ